jgi:hypothetical protein
MEVWYIIGQVNRTSTEDHDLAASAMFLDMGEDRAVTKGNSLGLVKGTLMSDDSHELPPIRFEYLAQASDELDLALERLVAEAARKQAKAARRRAKATRKGAKATRKRGEDADGAIDELAWRAQNEPGAKYEFPLQRMLNQYFVQGVVLNQMRRAKDYLDRLDVRPIDIAFEMGVSTSAVTRWTDDPPHISLVIFLLFQGLFRKQLIEHVEAPLWLRTFEAYAYAATRARRKILGHHKVPILSAEEFECVRNVLGSEHWSNARDSRSAGERSAAAKSVQSRVFPRLAKWLSTRHVEQPDQFWAFGERLFADWSVAICIVEAHTEPELKDTLNG